jgi:hypothetical protein
MKKIQDIAALFFITAVAVLSVISILGVWNFLEHDVIMKSFETLGLLAFAAVIVIVAGHFIGSHAEVGALPEVPNPLFNELRKGTIGLVIVSVSILALLGVLSIWEVVGKEILNKSFTSLLVIAFGAFVMILTCLEREGWLSESKANGGGFSAGRVIAVLLGIFILLPMLLSFMASSLFR